MGQRIHKALGYGLTGLKSAELRFVDSLLNPEGYLRLDWEDREIRFSITGYLDWLRTQSGNAGDVFSEIIWPLPTLDECVVDSIEFGLSDTFLIVPPHLVRSWTRYNDPIDYEVEVLRADAGPGRVDPIAHGIHPYDQIYWDRRTGKKLGSSATLFRMPKLRALDLRGIFVRDNAAKSLGFKDEEEAREHVRPVVPDSVLYLCQYLNVFADPDTARYLEPMAYTYWA